MIEKLIWWIEDKIFEYQYYKEHDTHFKLSLTQISNLEHQIYELRKEIKRKDEIIHNLLVDRIKIGKTEFNGVVIEEL